MKSANPDETVMRVATRASGRVSVAARDLSSDDLLELDAGRLMPTASVIKLAILIEALRQHDTGGVDLDQGMSADSADHVRGSGVLKVLQGDARLSLRDMVTLMVVVSDNSATNIVLDALGGPSAVNSCMDRLGLRSIRLHNRVDFQVIGTDVRRLGEATASDLCRLCTLIARRDCYGVSVSETAEAILGRQQFVDLVPRYMLFDPYGRERGDVQPVSVANKTGFSLGVRADAGIVRFAQGGGFTYSVMLDGSDDRTFLPEAEPSVALGLIGRALLQRWWGNGASLVPWVASAHDSMADG